MPERRKPQSREGDIVETADGRFYLVTYKKGQRRKGRLVNAPKNLNEYPFSSREVETVYRKLGTTTRKRRVTLHTPNAAGQERPQEEV